MRHKKTTNITACIAIAALATANLTLQPALAQQPNVIVIISDDAGYADFGFMNNLSGETSQIPTPNLDALASSGVTFSRAYVAANCQPTRAAIVTGGYQQRIGNENVGNNHYLASQVFEGVPVATDTIWDRMKGLGYTTGAVGKWHLGQIENTTDSAGNVVLGNRPQNQGVDEFYGIWHGSRDYTVGRYTNPNNALQIAALREAIVHPDGTITDKIVEAEHDGEYITNTFGDYAVDFIGNHHDDANPFMLYQAFTAPHKPWTDESPDFAGITGLDAVQDTYRKQVASMMVTMDKEIGRMLDKLDDPNGDGNNSDSIRENTLVVFVNDNGGVAGKNDALGYINGTDNGDLSSFKGSAKDGGIRVPMIIAGAGIDASKKGTVFHAPVHGIDILPTAFGAGGGTFGPSDDKIDGVNLLPYINGENTDAPHDVLVHRWRGTFAVIKGDMKLINTRNNNARPSGYQLFNVANDIGETNNLINASANAALVEELKRDLTHHEAFFDKARYAILNRSVDDEPNSTKTPEPLNIFDHFALRLDAPGSGNQMDWSDDDAWLQGGTTDVKNMYSSDAFAGAIVEFPTSDSQSYTANNDLLRQTGMDYMLNKIILSGQFNGSENRDGTIEGNDLLFTNSLAGAGPELAVDATKLASTDFAYEVNNDLMLFDDFSITGDGNVSVTIRGQIRDYFEARDLTKSGSSKVTLTGNNTYGGKTTVTGGTLAMSGNATLSNTVMVEVQSGALFDVASRSSGGLTFHAGQALSGSGTFVGDVIASNGARLSPGSGIGELTIMGDATVSSGSVINVELGGTSIAGTDYDRLTVSGNLRLLGGDLNVSLQSGFNPSSGDTFNVIGFASLAGSFDAVNLPELTGGMTWDTHNLQSAGVLSVNAGGDFNNDGRWDSDDINALVAEIVAGTNLPAFDMNGDGFVNASDLTDHNGWLAIGGRKNPEATNGKPFLAGDVNLDGRVDDVDFVIWNSHRYRSHSAWCSGDLNADGVVDVSDFNIWNRHKGSSSVGAASVPEPHAAWLFVLAAASLCMRCRHHAAR